MDRVGLSTGGPQGFAINSQMRVIHLALWRVEATWFVSTPALRAPFAQRKPTGSRPRACHPLVPAHCNTSSDTACSYVAAQSVGKDEGPDAESTPLPRSNCFGL